jgi:DNA-binding transcriptional regulator PaaX
MGRLEAESATRSRRNKVRQAILAAVQIAGLLALVAVVPNSIAGMQKLGIITNARHKDSTKRSFKRLLQSGHLRLEGGRARLTKKGEAELKKLQAYQAVKTHRKWDKKWRILIFDIPEYRKSTRDKLRRTVEHIGFVRLQDSVWVYPYDCEDLITLLKADFKIGRDILYMIVDVLEGDRVLRQRFDLH